MFPIGSTAGTVVNSTPLDYLTSRVAGVLSPSFIRNTVPEKHHLRVHPKQLANVYRKIKLRTFLQKKSVNRLDTSKTIFCADRTHFQFSDNFRDRNDYWTFCGRIIADKGKAEKSVIYTGGSIQLSCVLSEQVTGDISSDTVRSKSKQWKRRSFPSISKLIGGSFISTWRQFAVNIAAFFCFFCVCSVCPFH